MQKSNLVRDSDGWQTVASKTEFASPHLKVATDEVQTPMHAKPQAWSIVHRKPAVVIAAVTAEGKFVLIREERIPIRAAIWAFPAGQVDGNLEPSEELRRQVASRELQEEAGYELAPGAELTSLGYFFSSPGFTDEVCYLYLARPACRGAGGSSPEESEGILDVREFSGDVLRQMIASGEVRDSNTLSVWARLVARGDIFP